MDIRERDTLALLAAQTEFQVEIPKMETIQPIITYLLEMNPLTEASPDLPPGFWAKIIVETSMLYDVTDGSGT